MSEIRPIDCTSHDYLEVACLFSYKLKLRQRSGAVVTGIAVTTRTAGGAEFLVLKVGDDTVEVPLHELKNVSVLTLDATFSELKF